MGRIDDVLQVFAADFFTHGDYLPAAFGALAVAIAPTRLLIM
jgi:hypothetical protein